MNHYADMPNKSRLCTDTKKYLQIILSEREQVTEPCVRWSHFLKNGNILCACMRACLVMSNCLWHGLPGSAVHGILQTRILEQVAISSSRGSSRPRDRTCVSLVSCISKQIPYHCTTQETPKYWSSDGIYWESSRKAIWSEVWALTLGLFRS